MCLIVAIQAGLSAPLRAWFASLSFYRRAMRPVRALAIYLAVVFLGGALLARGSLARATAGPHVHARRGAVPSLCAPRAAGLALIGLWPLLKVLASPRRETSGWSGPRARQKTLAAVFCSDSSPGVRGRPGAAERRTGLERPDRRRQARRKTLGAAIAAILVATLEEILRGALFGGCARCFTGSSRSW